MMKKIDYIIEQIGNKNPLHCKKLKKSLNQFDDEYGQRADCFLDKYSRVLANNNQTLDFAIECYLKMLADFNYEAIRFVETGEYSNKSFKDVNEKIYANPEIMEYHMHGLLLSQFLWAHHYKIFLFFQDIIKSNKIKITNYLEIGAGHGLYVSEAVAILGEEIEYTVVDISETSIELAKKMINKSSIKYIQTDALVYSPCQKYNFIAMGEVLEHVEEPAELLKKVFSLLNEEGKLFITVPANAPAIDHIYLFRNADEIRTVIKDVGFKIDSDINVYAEDVSREVAERFKVPLMYAGVLSKK